MSLIRPQTPLILVAFISSLILSSTAGNTALETKGPPSEQTPDKQLSYTFAEVRIEFPSSLWELVAESEMDISFVRRYTIGFSNSFGILLVDVHPMARGWTREQHIKEYFNYERIKSRQGSAWSGFVEGTMEIDGVHYPIMRYSISDKTYRSKSDGLFMIVFPDDLEKRHRFYVLMLAEIHPEGKPAPGFPDLEFIVRNLKILPVLVSSDSIGVFELHYDAGDDTEAPLYLGDQPPTMAIARELAAAGKEHLIVWSSCPGEDTRSEHGVYLNWTVRRVVGTGHSKAATCRPTSKFGIA